MVKDFDALHAPKHSIVDELFIVTADDNYVLARWAFLNGLDVDFFWLAVHCLEKYLKAALLLNGRSAKGYGHDITKLYPDVRSLGPELLPTDLVQPNAFQIAWRKETVDEFVYRLYRDGQADNRYQLYGYVRSADDLCKLDQLVFSVRRMCQPLEVNFLGERRSGISSASRREMMGKDPSNFIKLNSRLEEIMFGNRDVDLRNAALNFNFHFAPSDFPHTSISYKFASKNPVLFRRIYGPLERGPQYFPEADQLWEWVRNNIKLPDDLIKEIDKHRQEIKVKRNGT